MNEISQDKLREVAVKITEDKAALEGFFFILRQAIIAEWSATAENDIETREALYYKNLALTTLKVTIENIAANQSDTWI